MKRVLGVIGILVLLIIIAVGVAVYFSQDLVTRIVERVGSRVTDVDVTLQATDLSAVLDGSVTFRGLRIGNPPNFGADYAFDLGEAQARLDTGTLRDDTLVVHEIVMEAPAAIFELLRDGSTNFGRIQANVDAFLAERRPEEVPPDEGGRLLIIDSFQLRGGQVTVLAPALDREVTATLPDIHLTGLGRETGGITPAEVMAQLFAELHRHLARAVAGMGLPDVSALAERGRREAEAALGAARRRAGEAAAGVEDEVREEAERRADDAIRGIEERLRERLE